MDLGATGEAAPSTSGPAALPVAAASCLSVLLPNRTALVHRAVQQREVMA